jgi:hypothetical protein
MRAVLIIIVGILAFVCVSAIILKRDRSVASNAIHRVRKPSELAQLAIEAPARMQAAASDLPRLAALVRSGEFAAAGTAADAFDASLAPLADLSPQPEGLAGLRMQVRGVAQDAAAGAQLAIWMTRDVPSLVHADGSADWVAYDGHLQDALRRLDSASEMVRAALARQIRDARSQLDGRRHAIAAHAQQQRRELAAEAELAARCGPNPQDELGVVSGVHGYLMRVANDPSSIEDVQCTPPVLTQDRCWTTTCSFRGNNAFGARVLNSARFDIANGHVVRASRH